MESHRLDQKDLLKTNFPKEYLGFQRTVLTNLISGKKVQEMKGLFMIIN